MEKWKSKVLVQFEMITKEKDGICFNLDEIYGNLQKNVQYVMGITVKEQQKLMSTLNLSLKVFQKLTELNFELENFMAENDLYVTTEENLKKELKECIINMNTVENTVDNIPVSTCSKNPFNQPQPQPEIIPVASTSTAPFDAESSASTRALASMVFDTSTTPSEELDMSHLKDSLGLNKNTISNLKEFYDKPRCNVEFLAPEKDCAGSSGTSNVKKMAGNDCGISNVKQLSDEVECSNNTNTSIQQKSSEDDCSSIVKNSSDDCTSTEVKKLLIEESTSSSSSSMNSSISDKQADSVNLLEIKNPQKVQTNSSEPATAIQKLQKYFNNVETQKKKEVVVPDYVRLKSTNHVIKNDLTPSTKKKKLKNKKTSFYDIPDKEPPQANELCVFSHIETPSEFYLHICDPMAGLIDSIPDKIEEYVSKHKIQYTTKLHALTNIGKYCVAFVSQYDRWYRAEVINWFQEKKTEEVYIKLVDYGDMKLISYKKLQKISKDLAEIPKLAIKCHLPLLYPPNSTFLDRLTDWPPTSIDAISGISDLHSSERGALFTVCYAQKIGDSVAIDMFRDGENPDNTVGQILMDLGLAVQITEEVDETHMELEQFVQDVSSFGNAENINEAVAGYDARDEARICRFTRPDLTCFKGKNCKLEHVPMSRGGFTTDQVECYKGVFYDLPLPPKGSVEQILITAYKDVCSFYALIINQPMSQSNYVIDKELYLLIQSMNSARMVSKYEKFKVPPAIGEMCIALHWSKKWLRGVVRRLICNENNDPVNVELFMLDFGDTLEIPITNIRKMKQQFLNLPVQVVECYLSNYSKKNGCDEEEAKKYFEQNILFRNYLATIMSSGMPLRLDVDTFQGLDVGKALEQQGFAEKRTIDIHPDDSTMIGVE